jgi:predicted nucleic acid-binding protein
VGELTKAVESRVFASLEEDIRAGFLQVHPIADEHLIAALGLITRLGRFPLRTLDALHLAIAQGTHVRRLATADKVMAVAGKAIGLGVVRFF